MKIEKQIIEKKDKNFEYYNNLFEKGEFTFINLKDIILDKQLQLVSFYEYVEKTGNKEYFINLLIDSFKMDNLEFFQKQNVLFDIAKIIINNSKEKIYKTKTKTITILINYLKKTEFPISILRIMVQQGEFNYCLNLKDEIRKIEKQIIEKKYKKFEEHNNLFEKGEFTFINLKEIISDKQLDSFYKYVKKTGNKKNFINLLIDSFKMDNLEFFQKQNVLFDITKIIINNTKGKRYKTKTITILINYLKDTKFTGSDLMIMLKREDFNYCPDLKDEIMKISKTGDINFQKGEEFSITAPILKINNLKEFINIFDSGINYKSELILATLFNIKVVDENNKIVGYVTQKHVNIMILKLMLEFYLDFSHNFNKALYINKLLEKKLFNNEIEKKMFTLILDKYINKDYMEFNFMVMPFIESFFRKHAIDIGINPQSLNDGTSYILLNKLIEKISSNDKSFITKDKLIFINQVLLKDGLNLRNNISHGLYISEFGGKEKEYISHLLIQIIRCFVEN